MHTYKRAVFVLALASILALAAMLLMSSISAPVVVASDGGTRSDGNLDNISVANQEQRILVTGDTHYNKWKGTVSAPTFGIRVESLFKFQNLDFRVNLGDWDFDGCGHEDPRPELFEAFVLPDVPTFHVPGDHDGGMTGQNGQMWSLPQRSYYYLKDNILHVFIADWGGQSFAGALGQLQKNFIEYLVKYKFPDRTTFFYSHEGWENMPWWKIHTNEKNHKSANYVDVEWWENLFRNNPDQQFCLFGGHVHYSWSDENAFMWNNTWYPSDSRHSGPGVLKQTVEGTMLGSEARCISEGDTSEFPVVYVRDNQIELRYYCVNSQSFEDVTHIIDVDTSFSEDARDEFGYFRVFTDNKKVSNYNHYLGENRRIEIVGLPSNNLFPGAEMRESFPWFYPSWGHHGKCATQPWLESTMESEAVEWDSENKQMIFHNTSGKVFMCEEGKPKNLPWKRGPQAYFSYRDTPPAAEDVEYELKARIYSETSHKDGLTLKLSFDTAEWGIEHTVQKIRGQQMDLSSGWNTYTFTATSPVDVSNPDFDVPRLRVRPSITFNSTDTYRLDTLEIKPVQEGETSDLKNPSISVGGTNYSYSGELGAWGSVVFDAPYEDWKEKVEMQASGGRTGMMIFRVVEPRFHAWNQPLYLDGDSVESGPSRISISSIPGSGNLYMTALDGVFTVGDHWTENCQNTARLVLDDIPSEESLGMWDLTAESGDKVAIRELRAETDPVENITWTARSESEVTFTVGDLTEGRKYLIYDDGSEVGEGEANSWGEISFTSQGGTSAFSVVEVVEPAKFELSDLSLSKSEVEPGESTTVSVQVKNTGGKEGTHTVELSIDGKTKTQGVTLDPGASDTVTFDVSEEEEGIYQVSVEDLSGSFEVVSPMPLEFSNLSVNRAEVSPGETVQVSVDVTNAGESSGSGTVELSINGETKTQTVTLSPDESKTVTFTVPGGEEGTYEVSVGGLTESFEVVKPSEGGGVPLLPIITGVIVAIIVVGAWIWGRRRL